MRCLAFALVSVWLALLPGCGGGGSAPLDEALGYLPKEAPFVVAVDTNVRGSQYRAAGRLVRKFPFGGQAGDVLKRQLERSDEVDFDRDVRPLLGNAFVVGSPSARSFNAGLAAPSFVTAIKTKDGDKLKDLLKRQSASEQGKQNGATIYRDDEGRYVAVKGDVLVGAGSRAQLERALAQRARDDHLDRGSFEDRLGDLPSSALARGYVDARTLLRASARARQALSIPWVGALGAVGFIARAENDGIDVEFKAKTDQARLRDGQLPLATGREPPAVVRRPGELSVGVRDPGQIADFILDAGQAAIPQFTAGRRQLERAVGIDLKRDLTDQLAGGSSLNVSPSGGFGLRADVRDPVAMKRTLDKLVTALPRFAKSTGAGRLGVAKPKRGEDLYAIARPDGQSVVFGVVGRVLVAANSARRAGRLAGERPTTVPGAQGSLVLDADAQKLAGGLLRRFLPNAGLPGALFTSPLGELTGSVSTDRSGLRGRLKLGID